MLIDVKKPAPPSDDKRWKIVAATMRRHGETSHALIESLHTVQEAFGFIDKDALRFVAGTLRVPLSKAMGVATFYHHFQMKPKGKHTCVICTGTACYIKGVPELLSAVKEKFGIAPGDTTPDNNISLLTARCVGACGLAPVAVLDGEVMGKLTPAQLVERVGRCACHDAD
jgi:bidirectional [NiFe] hydrogenase diaphorase subunit